MVQVNVPNFGSLNFPDDMSAEDIDYVIRRDIAPLLPKEEPLPTSQIGLGAGAGQFGMQADVATALGELSKKLGYESTGAFFEDYAQKYNKEAEKRATAAKTTEAGKIGSLEDFFNYLSYTLGSLAPPALTALGAGVAGGVGAGALGAGALGVGIAAGGAGAGSMILPNLGGNLQAQDEAGIPRDLGPAAAAAVAQSAVELLGPELFMLKALIKPAATTASRSFLKRLPGTAGKAGAGEAGEEVGQEALQRLQAEQEILSPEAIQRYAESGAAGLVGGLALSPLANVRRGPTVKKETPPEAVTPPPKQFTLEEANTILGSWGIDPEITGRNLNQEERITLASQYGTEKIRNLEQAKTFLFDAGIDPEITGRNYSPTEQLNIAQSLQQISLSRAWTPEDLANLGIAPKLIPHFTRKAPTQISRQKALPAPDILKYGPIQSQEVADALLQRLGYDIESLQPVERRYRANTIQQNLDERAASYTTKEIVPPVSGPAIQAEQLKVGTDWKTSPPYGREPYFAKSPVVAEIPDVGAYTANLPRADVNAPGYSQSALTNAGQLNEALTLKHGKNWVPGEAWSRPELRNAIRGIVGRSNNEELNSAIALLEREKFITKQGQNYTPSTKEVLPGEAFLLEDKKEEIPPGEAYLPQGLQQSLSEEGVTPQKIKKLNEIVSRVTRGQGTITNLFSGAVPEELASNISDEAMFETGVFPGADIGGFAAGKDITLGYAGGKNAPIAAYHESYHVVENIPGMFTNEEHAAKERDTEQVRASLEDLQRLGAFNKYSNIAAMSREEVRAYSFQVFAEGRDTDFNARLPTSIRRIYLKLASFLKDIGRVLTGREMNVKDVFEHLYSGRVGRDKKSGVISNKVKASIFSKAREEVQHARRSAPKDKTSVKEDLRDIGLFNSMAHTNVRIAELFPQARRTVNQLFERKATRTKVFQDSLEGLQPLNALNNAQKSKITNMLYEAWKQEVPVNVSDKEATVGALRTTDPKEIAAIKAHQDTMRNLWRGLKDAFTTFLKDGGVAQEDLDKIVGQFERASREGYMPAMRFGKWAVSVKDASGKLLHLETFSKSITALSDKAVKNQALARIKELEKQYPGAKIRDHAFNHSQWQQMGLDQLPFIEQVASALGMSKDEDIQTLFKKLREEITKKTFQGFLGRARRIPGIVTPDNETWYLPKADTIYSARAASFIANMKHQNAMADALKDLKDFPALAKHFEGVNEYSTSPKETGAWLKSVAFMYLLGGNISSAMVNLTQLLHTTSPALTAIAGARAIPAMAKGFKQALSMASLSRSFSQGIDWDNKPPNIPQDMWEATKRAHDSGLLGMVQLKDITGYFDPQMLGAIEKIRASGTFNRNATKFLETMAGTFGFVESLNRLTTFFTTYELTKNNPAALKKANAFLKTTRFGGETLDHEGAAKALTELTQFLMSKENRPAFMRYGGIFTEVPTQFMQFPIMMLETMGRYLGNINEEGHAKALSLMVLGLGMTSGLMGMPFVDFSKGILEAAYNMLTGKKIDFEKEVRDFMQPLGDFRWAESFLHGPARMLGFDISHRASVDFPRADMLKGNFSGPIGGVASSLMQAEKWYSQGFTWNAIAALLPLAFRNVANAYLMTEEGYRQSSGRVLVAPENLSEGDILRKAVGFQPTSVARASELMQAEDALKTAVQDRKEYYTEQLVALRVGATLASRRGDEARYRFLMEDYRDLLKKAREEDMREKNPENWLRIRGSDISKRVQQDLAGRSSKQAIGKASKIAIRGPAKDLRDLYLGP